MAPLQPEVYLAALHQWGGHPVQMDLDVATLTVLVGALQLSTRHPRLPSTTRRVIQTFIAEVEARLEALAPVLAQGIRLGNNPTYDA